MKILGINQVSGILAWMHDSSAAIVIDGKVIAAAEEERFNRQRHARGYPKLAVEFCLKEAKLTLRDIDAIAVSYNPYSFLTRGRINFHFYNLFIDLANIFIFKLYLRMVLREAGSHAKIIYIDHHLAHAASAYRCSGYTDANVLTIDGSGETESFTFFEGKAGVLTRKWDIPFRSIFEKEKNHSIGMIYTSVTSLLGMGTNGEGKTMGLASYGTPTYDFSKILSVRNHVDYTIERTMISKLYGHLKRKPSDPLTQEHKNLAASLQDALEKAILALAKDAYKTTGIRNFALAGGVALNCNANSAVLAEEYCDAVFIQPAASDAGASLGAALEASWMLGDKPDYRMEDAYLGLGFTDEEVEKALKEIHAEYSVPTNISASTAKLIDKGFVVGWCQGRAEFGPRALGTRSILANPTIKGMDTHVNEQIKHRESWRPFAPSVAEESASTYFEGVAKATESPFMLHTFYVKQEFRDSFPAITHVDGSSRIQTVRKNQNEVYYNLLMELKKLNGHAIVMNTSFNDKGEPIVASHLDAIRCYFSTGLDALAIGKFLLVKKHVTPDTITS